MASDTDCFIASKEIIKTIRPQVKIQVTDIDKDSIYQSALDRSAKDDWLASLFITTANGDIDGAIRELFLSATWRKSIGMLSSVDQVTSNKFAIAYLKNKLSASRREYHYKHFLFSDKDFPREFYSTGLYFIYHQDKRGSPVIYSRQKYRP